MKLRITNMQRGTDSQDIDASVEVSSFQANSKLVSLKVTGSQKEKARAALESIGLRPHSQQNGCLLVLQTDQVHIRGEGN